MIIIFQNRISGSSGFGNYSTFKPWQHASGVERWWIDANGTHDLEGYRVRFATDVEIQADPRYAAWLADRQLTTAQTQAQVNFSTVPQWMRTGTADQGEAWIEVNVTNLAGAKVALKNLVRIIVFLRDFVKFSN